MLILQNTIYIYNMSALVEQWLQPHNGMESLVQFQPGTYAVAASLPHTS